MTKQYWDERYDSGLGAGDGSRGPLLEFKRLIIQEAITRYKAAGSVVDLGCGDGTTCELLKAGVYTGLDISTSAIALAKKKSGTKKRRFFSYKRDVFDPTQYQSNTALSIDVIMHLAGEERENHLNHLFAMAEKLVIIYGPDRDAEKLPLAPHMNFEPFTPYIKEHFPEWVLNETITNKYPATEPAAQVSFCDFFIYVRTNRNSDNS